MTVDTKQDITPPTTNPQGRYPIDPQVITGYLIRFFQLQFIDLENIQNQYLQNSDHLWTPDDMAAESQGKNIKITTVNEYSPTSAGQQPAILIKRNPIKLDAPITIGDVWHTPTTLLGDGVVDPNTQATLGHNQQQVSITGSHTVYAVHGTGGGAEILGIALWLHTLDYQRVIRQDLALDRFRIGSLGATGKLSDGDGAWVTPFTVEYRYQRSTILRAESPVLRAVSSSIIGV